MKAEKAYRSMGSNVWWIFRRQLKFSSGLFFLWALQTPIHVGMSGAAIYLPSLVVAETVRQQPLAHAAMTLGALMLAMFMGGIADKLLYYLV